MSQKVLITGGAGFIGSRLAHRFSQAGFEVVVLDSLSPQVHGANPDEDSSLLKRTKEVARVIEGTVTSKDDLRDSLDGVSLVVHLAAETGTGQSMYEIDRYVATNVGGTSTLLEILVNEEHAVRRIVVASSRSIYGEGAYKADDGTTVYPPHRSEADLDAGRFDVTLGDLGPLTMVATGEDAKLHPSSVYGITKQMQESLVMTVAPTAGVEAVSLRYQNVYGPGQSLANPYTGILSIFSNLIRQGKKINIFEDGLESRDFVFIDDVVESTFLAATQDGASGEVLNVGSGVATTVNSVVDALYGAFEVTPNAEVSGNYRLGDIRHNIADVSRAREVLGFAPTVSFEDGVRQFVDWVKREPLGGGGYEESLKEMSERNLLK